MLHCHAKNVHGLPPALSRSGEQNSRCGGGKLFKQPVGSTQILRGLIGMCSVTESKRYGSAGPSLRDLESGLRWSLGVTMALVEWIVSLKPFIHLGVNLCF